MSPYSVEQAIILNSSTANNAFELEIKSSTAQPLVFASNNDISPNKEKRQNCPSKKNVTILKPLSLNRNSSQEERRINDNNNIRERYMHKLGITRHCHCHQSAPKIMKKSALSKCTNDNHVQFNDNVTITPVPSRHSYSPTIKQRLWSNPIESKQNLLRNSYEYEYEGRNWRHAIEESNMVNCAITGKKVHPYHATIVVHNYYHSMTKGHFLLYSKTMASMSAGSSSSL